MIDVYCLSIAIGQRMDMGNYYYHGLIMFKSGNFMFLRKVQEVYPHIVVVLIFSRRPYKISHSYSSVSCLVVWRCVLCVIVSIILTRELSNTACVITCSGPRL